MNKLSVASIICVSIICGSIIIGGAGYLGVQSRRDFSARVEACNNAGKVMVKLQDAYQCVPVDAAVSVVMEQRHESN